MKRPRSLYYNRQGEPIEATEWLRQLEGPIENRVVEKTSVRDAEVSTVWLGLDHSHGDGPPILFETMVFGLETDDEPMWRYSTEEEARAGHWAVVRQVQDMLRVPHGTQEDRIVPDDSRPLAEVEPGSVDISGLDKAALLAAVVNAASLHDRSPLTHEDAAAIIQDRLGGVGTPGRAAFDFDECAGRLINLDLTGPRIRADQVTCFNRDAGEGTLERVVGELRAAHDARREERARRE